MHTVRPGTMMVSGRSCARHGAENGREGWAMSVFWDALGYVLYVYILIILARFVVEATRQFARSWRPVGLTAVGVEVVYVATDPPVKLLRRLIPPLQLGAISLDLSILILLLGILALYWLVLSLR
jgi:YggT family protein